MMDCLCRKRKLADSFIPCDQVWSKSSIVFRFSGGQAWRSPLGRRRSMGRLEGTGNLQPDSVPSETGSAGISHY